MSAARSTYTIGIFAVAAGLMLAVTPARAALAAPKADDGYRDYVLGRHAWSTDRIQDAARYFARVRSIERDDPILLRRTFELALAAGNVPLTLETAREVLKVDPQNSTAVLVLIADDFRQGDHAAAERRLDGLAAGGIEAVMAPILRAWIAYGRGQGAAALQAINLEGTDGFIRGYRLEHQAYLRLMTGDAAGASAAFAELLATGQGGGRLRWAAAAAAQASGDDAQARRLLMDSETGARDPLPQLAYPRRQLERAGKIASPVRTPADGAAELFFRAALDLSREEPTPLSLVFARVAAVSRPDFAEAHLLTAEILRQTNEFPAALDALKKVGAGDALALQAGIERAGVLESMGQVEAALTLLRELIETSPALVAPRLAYADILRRQERYVEAAEGYGLVIDRITSPAATDWALYYMRGVCHERARQWALAEADLRRALQLRPDDPNVLNYLGYSLLEQGRDLAEAQALIERAVEKRPGDGFIIDSLGWVHYTAGRYQEAVEQLEAAVADQPGDPTINEHLGDAYWRVGRQIEARFRWRAALDCEPDPDQARRLKDRIEWGLDLALSTARNGR